MLVLQVLLALNIFTIELALICTIAKRHKDKASSKWVKTNYKKC